MASLIRVAIRPNTDLDRRNCEAGLRQLAAEDPTLVVQAGPGADEITVGALGEVHLEIVMDRLRREFEVSAGVGRPEIVCREVGSLTLEPVMRVEVTVAEAHGALVMGDLVQRQARIVSCETQDGEQRIIALAPLSQLFGYGQNLNALTRGPTNHRVTFDGYQLVPDDRRHDDDTAAPVRAPLSPPPAPNDSAIAIPEPDEDA